MDEEAPNNSTNPLLSKAAVISHIMTVASGFYQSGVKDFVMVSTMGSALRFAQMVFIASTTHQRCISATTVNAAAMAGLAAGSWHRNPLVRAPEGSLQEKGEVNRRRKLVAARAVSSNMKRNYHGTAGEDWVLSHRRSFALQSRRRERQEGLMTMATNGPWIRLLLDSRLFRTSHSLAYLPVHLISLTPFHSYRHEYRNLQLLVILLSILPLFSRS